MARQTEENQTQYPKLSPVRQASPAMNALLSKLTPDNQSINPRGSRSGQIGINRFMLERISSNTAQNVMDSDSIAQLLPDIELVEQILVGSILSPKDMVDTNTSYVTAENQFDSELAAPMLEVVETHFKRDYKIDDRMDLILEKILTTKGACITAVLPENNLDMIINGGRRLSMETFDVVLNRLQNHQPLGFLGHPTEARVSMESFNGNYQDTAKVKGRIKDHAIELGFVTVTDNYDVLKSPDFKKRRREMAISSKLQRRRTSMESAAANLMHSEGLTAEQIDQLYRKRPVQGRHAQVLVSQPYMERAPVGHPLSIDLPIEAVVPVFVPGKPDEHVGYFVLLDNFGRPVVKSNGRDFYGEMRTSFQENRRENTSSLLRMTREAMGNLYQEGTLELEQVHQTYAAILENDLQNRLRNGMYDEELEIGMTEEIQRIMLYRAFKAQNTQLLYVPAELISYIAFNYNEDGIGQTLLARSKILANMRSILLFADTMSAVRNAIGRKKVNINIDNGDTDPEKTISDIQTMILESAHRGFPLGAPDPSQSLDYLNRAGFDFAINVDADTYAQTKVEYDDYVTQVQAGNPELQDKLRRMHVSSFGLPPDIGDPQSTPDFAVSVVNNNLILTRRVKRYQKLLCTGMTKFVRCYISHSSILLERLTAVVDENEAKRSPEQKKQSTEEIVQDFIAAVEMRLPEPENSRIEQHTQSLEQYITLLDRSLEAFISADLFPEDALGGTPGVVEKAIAQIRAYFIRQWLAKENIMPELEILTRMDEDHPAFSILDIQSNYMRSLGSAMQQFVKGLADIKKDWDKTFAPPTDTFDTDPMATEGGEGEPMDGDDLGGSDFGGDDFGTGDDLGEGTDTGFDDLTTPEEEPGETTEVEEPEETPAEEEPVETSEPEEPEPAEEEEPEEPTEEQAEPETETADAQAEQEQKEQEEQEKQQAEEDERKAREAEAKEKAQKDAE